MHDLRYAIRALRAAPGFTLIAAGTLALAIAVNTIAFTPTGRTDLVVSELRQTARESDRYLQMARDYVANGKVRRAVFDSLTSMSLGVLSERRFKELVLTLYYLSQPGATRELRYEHTPGKWEPSIEIGPDTRAWAT